MSLPSVGQGEDDFGWRVVELVLSHHSVRAVCSDAHNPRRQSPTCMTAPTGTGD